jgi:SRSO17 transposase
MSPTKAWTDERERCRRAGIPDERAFATKPALAQQMLARAFAAGVLLAWVTGDSIYGDDRKLRSYLEGHTGVCAGDLAQSDGLA